MDGRSVEEEDGGPSRKGSSSRTVATAKSCVSGRCRNARSAFRR